ncbi:MAG: GAF domain-containing protein [Thermoleophilia bacterium]
MRVGRASGEDWWRLGEAASTLGVSLSTLRRWSDSGKLRCYRSSGGHRRFRRSDVLAFLAAQTDPGRKAGVAVAWPEHAGAESPRPMAALPALARAAAEGAGVTSCLLGLSAGRDLIRLLADHAPDGARRVAPAGGTAPRGQLPAAARVLRTGRRVVIADLDSTDLLSAEEADVYRRRGERAILALPLVAGERVVGVMELADSHGAHAFTGATVAFAQFIARQAAAALAGDAEASEDLPPRGEAIAADWASRSSTGDLSTEADRSAGGVGASAPGPQAADALIRAAATASDAKDELGPTLDALCQSLGADSCVIHRVEAGGARAVIVAATFPSDAAGWNLDERPAAALAVRERRIIAAPSDPRQAAPGAAARHRPAAPRPSVLFAPLARQGTTIGLLEVTGDAKRLAAATPLVTKVSGLLAAVLSESEQIALLQRRTRDLGSVLKSGLEDTARLGSDETLRSVVASLAGLTATPVADVYAVEGETLRAIMSIDGGRFDDEWEGVVVPLRRYPCSRLAIETGEAVLIGDLDDPRLTDEGRHSLEKWGYRSQLCLPLIAGTRVLGLLELSDYVPRDFMPDLELVRGLGQVAAHALEVTALHEQVERRTRVLSELVELGALTSSSRDIDLLVRRVAERILTAVDAANCDIFRTVDAGLLCVASFDRSGFDERPVGNLMDVASYPTVVGAANAHQILVIASPDDPLLSAAERRVYVEFGFASEVCVPLVVNDKLYGLIDIYDTRERDYTEYLSFLTSAGRMLAGAFENAQLFDQLERRTTILRELVELGELAAQTQDQRLMLTALAERLRRTIQAADCDIFVLQEQQLRCLVSADVHGFDEGVVGKVVDMRRFPATAMAVRRREAVVVASLEDPRLTDDERTDMGEYGYESELCIPLVVDERVVGLIDIFDTRARDYGEYLDFLKSLGQIVAGALTRAVVTPPAGPATEVPT